MAANKVHWWKAPKGYKAIKCEGTHTCDNCALDALFWDNKSICDWDGPNFGCIPRYRKDGQGVNFIPR